MDTDSLVAYIKTDDIYKDVAEDVERRLDTSNYGLDRLLQQEKNLKSNHDKNYWMKIKNWY